MSFSKSNKKHTISAFTTAAVVITVSAGILSGCSLDPAKTADAAAGISTASTAAAVATASTNKTDSEPSSGSVHADFKALMDKEPSSAEVLKFLNDNMNKAPKEDASLMTAAFEALQQKESPKLQEKINQKNVQETLLKAYKPGFDLNDPNGISDEQTKKVIEETRNSGFKIETAEGMFFPIIDYSVYKNFSQAVTPDMKDYIALMAAESDKVPAKDAALVIGWDEMLRRAGAQQKFLDTWKDSPKAGEVGRILKNYVSYTIYGLNNTPLFAYDTKQMDPKAREAYEKAVQNGGEGKYFNMLSDYMKKIKENNYKLTDSLKKYMDGINTEY